MKTAPKVLIIVILVSLVFVLLLLGPFIAAHLSGQSQNSKIRNEVFSYVLENKDNMAVDNTKARQYFEYSSWHFSDAGVVYGYFYSPYDEYLNRKRAYRNGYLEYGTPNSGRDWCYFEKICDNWYYYEEHFG